MNIKLFLIVILGLSFFLYWLLPKTQLAKYLKMNEKFFYVMNIIGIICGISGLITTLVWGEYILTSHYYEIILLPAFLIYFYSLIIMKVKGADNVYDEKQTYDMTRAAAISLPYTVGVMFLLFAMSKEIIVEGLVWFPFYIYFTLTIYSVSTLVYFKKS